MPEGQTSGIANMESPQGKLTTTDLDLDNQQLKQGPRRPIHLVLDNIRSAFNVGSAFRTADAACIQKLYLCGISAYPPHPKLEKTALGSTEVVPWQHYPTTLAAVQELKAQRIPICVVELSTRSINFWDYQFPKPVALVLGHELLGVSDEVFPLADGFVFIPMQGKKTTLNISTATGVVLFEVLRQWAQQK